ncbi:MAG: hypothetical protein V1866_04485 [archaeon]
MRKRLHLKGWSKQEIAHAERILKHAEKNKHPHVRALEKSLYWFTLIIGVLGTILLSFVLIPILIAANSSWSYVFAGFFGFTLGFLIITIIRHMHWLQHHHHLSISLFIPILGIFDFFIIVTTVNAFNQSLMIGNIHNPVIAGAVFFICFVLPYGAFMLLRRPR